MNLTAWGLILGPVVSAVLIIAACAIDDYRISSDPANATAKVIEVTSRRAAVEFSAADGNTIRPRNGVMYPTQLILGQQVRVEYERGNPDLVRVAGRSWTLAVWPATSLVVFIAPFGVALLYLRRRQRSRTEIAAETVI